MSGEKHDADSNTPPAEAPAENTEGHKDDDDLESGETNEAHTKQNSDVEDTAVVTPPAVTSSANKISSSEGLLSPSTSTPGAFAINNPLSDNPIAESLRNVPTAMVTLESQASTAQSATNVESITAEPISVVVADPVEDPHNGDSSKNSNKSIKGSQGDQGRIQMFVAAAIAVLVVLVIALSIALSGEGSNTSSTGGDILSVSSRREDMIDFLGRFVDRNAFDPSHPDASEDRIDALRWIVEEDELELSIPINGTSIDDPLSLRLLERYVVALFYFATNGNDWVEQYNFLSQYDVCRWSSAFTDDSNDFNRTADIETTVNAKGIVCDPNGRIFGIRLWWNNLSGTLPEELKYLELKQFIVTGGNMVGTVPSFFLNFPNLENLSLDNNCFTGNIPDGLSDLPNLSIVSFYNNNYEVTGNLEAFCSSSTSFREGTVAVIADYGVDCSCCTLCDHDRYECDSLMWNATWLSINIGKDDAYDSRGNVLQFQSECLSPEQRGWIDDECPCVVEDVANPGIKICDDCTSEGSRPSYGN